ncbi:fumarylacetoacetate hydrolase family protein [Halobaculum magnesiiphilum]|uniref:Fumarylacetoacetate hydrolase family protein n=1 Tax=Halobaculum magnesiiphilum TaxID=1017351 RepID=A0A8T8WIR0_9EURY|nr:fumarylacetoacetate hydrolase family protein [Halobaculum magnesiiphilum]QZP39769.1 fumarylacetoacetate hydrolase family protein [Halobaculum magnesiiphilum]
MRLVRFSHGEEQPRLGALEPSTEVVVDLQAVGTDLDVGIPSSMRTLLARPRWQETVKLLRDYAIDVETGLHERQEVEILSPLVEPQKIICVGLNYIEHIEESEEERPENPVLFSKYASALVGPGQAIKWDPELTSEVDYEVELAAVVGKRARRIDRSRARDHIAGYTVANDVSARDLQFADEQWVRGKTLDTFCPLGPAIVTEDELEDPEDLRLWAEVNGERLQDSTTENLIFGIDELVSFCSRAFTLEPGDVILTGTPTGVGVFRDPPVLLDDGDQVTVGIEEIGELTNMCCHQ